VDDIARSFKVGPQQLALFATGFRSLFGGKRQKKILEDYFKDCKLSSLTKPMVSVVALNATRSELTTFHPFEPGRETPDPRIVDVALASAALPMLLPLFSTHRTHEDRIDDLIVDGGLSANNAIMVAISDAILYLSNVNGPPPLSSLDALSRITILSLGRREPKSSSKMNELDRFLFPRKQTQTEYDYGWLWVLYQGLTSFRVLVDASDAAAARYARDVMGPRRFFRFDPEMNGLHALFTVIRCPQQFIKKIENQADHVWNGGDEKAQKNELVTWISKHWMEAPRQERRTA
jgi:hypothetical protein